MGSIEHKTRYSAPPDRVWQVLVDFERAPERLRDVLRVRLEPPGPIRLGSVVHETRRVFGKERTEAMTVAELDPPRRLVLLATPKGARYRTEFRLDPDGAGTRLSVDFSGTGIGLLGKFMVLLLGPIASRAVKKALKRDLEDLRAVVEATSGHGSGIEGAPDAPDEMP